jgi:hypothetical protein
VSFLGPYVNTQCRHSSSDWHLDRGVNFAPAVARSAGLSLLPCCRPGYLLAFGMRPTCWSVLATFCWLLAACSAGCLPVSDRVALPTSHTQAFFQISQPKPAPRWCAGCTLDSQASMHSSALRVEPAPAATTSLSCLQQQCRWLKAIFGLSHGPRSGASVQHGSNFDNVPHETRVSPVVRKTCIMPPYEPHAHKHTLTCSHKRVAIPPARRAM